MVPSVSGRCTPWVISSLSHSPYAKVSKEIELDFGNLNFLSDHKLITDGPYAYVRHPSYTGFYGLTACSAFVVATSQLTERVIGLRTAIVHTGWLGVLGVIIVASTGVFICHHCFGRLRMENEEEMLEHEFGKEWNQYKREVPYKIFPFVW